MDNIETVNSCTCIYSLSGDQNVAISELANVEEYGISIAEVLARRTRELQVFSVTSGGLIVQRPTCQLHAVSDLHYVQ